MIAPGTGIGRLFRPAATVRSIALAVAVLACVVPAAGLGLGLAYLHATRQVAFAADPAASAARPGFDRLAASLAARGTEAFLVVRGDRLLYEWYRPGPGLVPGALGRRDIASASKAVTGGLALALLGREGLVGLDDPIGRHVPEWRQDPVRAGLTVRQLATHSSGLRFASRDDALPWGREYMRSPRRRVALALDTPLVGAPGEAVSYSNPGFTILGYAISRAAHEAGRGDLRAFLRERLWRPLGVPDGAWEIGYGEPTWRDGVQAYEVGGGTRLTARALARLGGLLAAGGTLAGEVIVDRGWLDAVTAPTGAALPADWPESRQPAAALGWWVNSNGAWPEAPRDTLVAAGAGHEVLVVVPSLGVAAVRLGERLGADHFGGDYWRALETALLGPLLEGLCGLPDDAACPRAVGHGGPGRGSTLPASPPPG